MSKDKKDDKGAVKKSKRPQDPGKFRRGVIQTVGGRKVLCQLVRFCHGKKRMMHIPIGG